MLRKLFVVLITLVLLVGVTACGDNNTSQDNENKEDIIEVEKEIFDVIITIPAKMAGEVTEDDLASMKEEANVKSITLNEDGSLTFEMSKKQHKELLKGLAASIDEGYQSMINSEDFPNITKIKTNGDYTKFEITTKNEEVDMSEGFMVIGLYLQSAIYNTFADKIDDNFEVTVKYFNADSGEMIDDWSSNDMNE